MVMIVGFEAILVAKLNYEYIPLEGTEATDYSQILHLAQPLSCQSSGT